MAHFKENYGKSRKQRHGKKTKRNFMRSISDRIRQTMKRFRFGKK